MFTSNVSSRIAEFENGTLSEDEALELFQDLVSGGAIYSLQGWYQERAEELIEDGQIAPPFNTGLY